ncbi:MAG TPA: hypothetical protein VEU94_00655 [Terriglobales bacterium]|nr:hypothetical protein [Terriglobales bacterium]
MTIKPLSQSIPTQLPPAKLYLDDIDEIVQILTESDTDCRTSFVAGRSKCDTLSDLKDLRGRTTHFVMDVSSAGKHQTLELTPSVTRIHIYEIGDQLAAWSKYVNVAAVFERRKLRLKAAVRMLGSWMLAGFWFLAVAVWMFVPHPARSISIYELTELLTGVLLVAAVAYYFASSHSVVYLRYPQRSHASRWLEDHKPEIIVGFICALMGGIATRIVEKAWR